MFGQGGGRKLAEESDVPFLGEIPIDPRVAECGDAGEPVVQRYPESAVAKAYLALAEMVDKELRQGSAPKELPEVQL
jgi:ATP-binding protein involved in chromosome partitioning